MKPMKYIYAFLAGALLMFAASSEAYAQKERNMGIVRSALRGLHYSVRAGYNIGGTSPLPLPVEIRGINSYKPLMGFSIEGNMEKYLNNNWGLSIGLRLENKMMSTDATVKNYKMSMISDEGRLDGYWTGKVKTKFRASYFSIPLLAAWKANERLRVTAGPYVSFLTSGDFSGHVFDGYLREGDPTGNKVTFSGESIAPYDFSDDLRTFQWGVQAGVSWRAFRHLNVHADLQWGLNDIFQKDFQTITFAMYPIYLNVGFGYAF